MKQTIKLLKNLDKIQTTEMGRDRIRKNLGLDMDDPVEYCKAQLVNQAARIYQEGKNWYCVVDDMRITVNASSYTIITAHKIKDRKNGKRNEL